jgi:hypothetical protein
MQARAILQQVNANYCSNGAILSPNGSDPKAPQTTAICMPSQQNRVVITKKTGLAMRTPSAKKSGEKA